MAEPQPKRRTTLLLDEKAQQQLRDLTELHGSQSAAVRAAIAEAHAALIDHEKRAAFIDWLVEEGGAPTASDEEWARKIEEQFAAIKESMRS